MWKLHFFVFLSIIYLCSGDESDCSTTPVPTTACGSPNDQTPPSPNQFPPPPPPPSPRPPKESPPSPPAPPPKESPPKKESTPSQNKSPPTLPPNPPPKESPPPSDSPKNKSPPKDQPRPSTKPPPNPQQSDPKSPPGGNNPSKSGGDTPTYHEQNLICVKAAEPLYKEPFCATAGNVDDGCKQLSDITNGRNPSCFSPNVCHFTTGKGNPAYVSSKNITGVTVYKECHNEVKVISKPDGGSASPGPNPSNGTKPPSPSGNTPTGHEQNLICVKAAEEPLYKKPFCATAGSADDGCEQLSDITNGKNPSCCSPFVCHFTTGNGNPAYVASKEIQGVTVYKGCRHAIQIISKPDVGVGGPNPDPGNGAQTGGPPPQSQSTPTSKNQSPVYTPPPPSPPSPQSKTSQSIGSPSKKPTFPGLPTTPACAPNTPSPTSILPPQPPLESTTAEPITPCNSRK